MRILNASFAVALLSLAGCDCSDEEASCRFVSPEEDALFVAADDLSPDPGFQILVEIGTTRIADGTGVQASAETVDGASVAVDSDTPLVVAGGDATGQVTLDLEEESEVVLSATVGSERCDVQFTVQPGSGCGIEFQDPAGDALNADDDTDTATEGLQYTVVVSSTIGTGDVTLFVDDAEVGTEPIAGATVSFDVTLAEGVHDLRAESGDCEANLGGLLVDLTPPVCLLCEPSGGPPVLISPSDDVDAVAAGVQIDFSVATDADVGGSVTLTVDGTDDVADVIAGVCSAGLPNHSAHAAVDVPEGDFQVSARCTDEAGNVTAVDPIDFRVLTDDFCPPEGTIDDLAVTRSGAERDPEVTATFTAPGDCISEDPSDPVEWYELRCTKGSVVMDEAAFATAPLYAMSGGDPLAPGSAESRTATLVFGPEYHCAVKGFDGAGASTAISNVADVSLEFDSTEVPGPIAGGSFGYSISPLGDVNDDGFDDVAVGSLADRAYVFFGSDTGISATPDVTLVGAAGSFFGASVSGIGDFVDSSGDAGDAGLPDLIVGAYGDAGFNGAAYVFRGRTNWSGIDSYTDADITMVHQDDGTTDDDGSSFGYATAWAGRADNDAIDDVLIGAPEWMASSFLYRGAAYLIHGPGAIATPVTWTIDSNTPELVGDYRYVGTENDGEFGISLATLGDVNPAADDRDDVVIAATSSYSAQFSLTGVGNVYVFRGRARPLVFTEMDADGADWTYVGVDGSATGQGLGATDANEDGDLDLVVGAPLLDLADHDEGEVFVFFGNGTDFSAAPDLTFTSGSAAETSDGLGWSVAGAVDFDGSAYDLDQDGFGEILFGTRQLGDIPGRGVVFYSDPGIASGAVFDIADVVIDGLGVGPVRNAAYAGDVNGDGLTDMLFSDPAYGSDDGRAEIRY